MGEHPPPSRSSFSPCATLQRRRSDLTERGHAVARARCACSARPAMQRPWSMPSLDASGETGQGMSAQGILVVDPMPPVIGASPQQGQVPAGAVVEKEHDGFSPIVGAIGDLLDVLLMNRIHSS